ncbi:MAG: protein YgfX [Betaproteobacteria bacterium]
MRIPPSVHVVLSPSRMGGAGIGVLAVATLALIVALPLHWPLQLTAVICVASSAAWSFHVNALHHGRFALAELRLAPDLILVACMGDGRLVAGHVRASTYVGSWFTSIVWRPDGRRWSRTILILPDMLPPEDFRRLRVMLCYARSAEVQEVPASQA